MLVAKGRESVVSAKTRGAKREDARVPMLHNPRGEIYIVIRVNRALWSCTVHSLYRFMQRLVLPILVRKFPHLLFPEYPLCTQQVFWQVARRRLVLLGLLGERPATPCSQEKSACKRACPALWQPGRNACLCPGRSGRWHVEAASSLDPLIPPG